MGRSGAQEIRQGFVAPAISNMGLIGRRVRGLPGAKYIMGEIERARLKADGIVKGRGGASGPPAGGGATPRPRRTGWKVGVKSRAAPLIMRAVRMNFHLQEVFNNSVVVLLLLACSVRAFLRAAENLVDTV